jgi:hypothetical protein
MNSQVIPSTPSVVHFDQERQGLQPTLLVGMPYESVLPHSVKNK